MTNTKTAPGTHTAVIDMYISTWNETDPAARRELVDASLGADIWYRDPLLEADGRDAYDAMIGVVQEQFPGLVMRRTSEVDAHHDLVRFGWELGAAGSDAAYAGIDVAKFDDDGHLHRIIGFTGSLASLDA